MSAWVEKWALPEMYAGVKGRGAQGAWYTTAMDLEKAFVADGTTLTGGAVDIYKCFDQVRREVVHRLLEAAGMPKQITLADRSFLEALVVRNTVAGGRGEPYRKPTSIPHGDPTSMVVTSLVLRAWVAQMKKL